MYETMIGLEVHVELLTKSKLFCNCTTEFDRDPNTHCCPICTGAPGALPVLNKTVVEYAVKAGLATNCEISTISYMHRKNYYYPDLPKAFQLSQFDPPQCKNGYIEIDMNGTTKKIRIRRIHIEEDVGKLLHAGLGDYSLVDYNRSGIPLVEIVTEPDINSPQELSLFLDKLKSILEYIEVSDCKMEEGSLRCDVNLSVGDGTQRTHLSETKNLNSFKAAFKAAVYEEKRHSKVLREGKDNPKQTRKWDDASGKTFKMRNKGESQDYRCLPDPNLTPVVLEPEWINRWKDELPELPHDRKMRFVSQFGIPEYDAEILTASKALANFYEEGVSLYDNPKNISNWIMGEVMRILNDRDMESDNIPFKSQQLVELLLLIDKGTINSNAGKQVLEQMFDTGKDAQVIVKEKGLSQISNEDQLLSIVKEIIVNNPKSVEDYKVGKTQALGFLVGQTMKASKGKANPQLVNQILKKELD